MAKARFAAVVRLALAGVRRGDQQGPQRGVHGGEVDVGPQHPVAFGGRVQALHLRQQVGVLGAQGGDVAQGRQAEHAAGVLHRVDAVVQKLLQQGQADADEQADQAGEDDALEPLGPDRRVGRLGASR